MTGFSGESLGSWLDAELAAAPQELAVRVRAALPPDWRSADITRAPVILADAAAAELRDLLVRGCDTRWAAPGLLTVDALVTYACQLVALGESDIDAGATEILERIVRTLPVAESRA